MLSVAHDPTLPGTMLIVGKPDGRWLPQETVERFSRLHGLDSLRIAFPGTVEVF